MHAKKAFGVLVLILAVAVVFMGILPAPALADPGRFIAGSWNDFGGESFSSNEPVLSTAYFYWHDASTNYRMTMTVHPDYVVPAPTPWGYINAPGLPVLSYSNPEWHALEANRIRNSAKIDILLAVYWGGNPIQFAEEEHWSNVGLEALNKGLALNEQQKKPIPNPKVGMFYDTNTLTGVDLSKNEGSAQFYRTIRDFYSRVHPKRWARIDGKAVVWLYHDQYPSRIAARAFDEARSRFARDFGGVQLFFVGMTGWRTPRPESRRLVDMTYAWGAAKRPDGILVADVVSVGPGFNYFGQPGINSRNNGDLYRGAWRAALKTNKKMIFIETWSEWFEATGIAPTYEYDRQELDTTRYFSEKFHSR